MTWKEKTKKQVRFYKRLVSLASDLPTPDKRKSGDSWKKKYGNSTKSSEIMVFPYQD